MRIALSALLFLTLCLPAAAQDIAFGDDSGSYPQDGECDDPRFAGPGMATSFDDDSILKDATDCSAMFQANRIRLVRTKAESDVAECASIDFGDDTSEWANDDECDDPRFTGVGVDGILNAEDEAHDAADCRALCAAGEIWLR
jgi:hypothetical protein